MSSEDSTVRRFVDDRLKELASMRMLHSRPRPGITAAAPVEVPWLAILGLSGAFAAYLVGAAWGGGSADKTLETVAADVVTMAEDIKAMRKDTANDMKAMRRERADQSKIMATLAAEVADLGDDYRGVAIQLASLGSLQHDQGLLVIELKVRADAANEDRSRIQQAVANATSLASNNKTDVRVAKRRLSFLESLAGISQPPPDKGEGL